MSLKINSDFSAMANSTLTQLHKHQGAMGKSIERVSTGYKINSAEDGSLKYYLSNKFNMKAEEQAASNEAMQTGAGFLHTADKALNSILTNLNKMREEMNAIANGQVSYNSSEYSQVKSEFEAFKSDIDSIISNTKFNGNAVLIVDADNPTVNATTQIVIDPDNNWTDKFSLSNLQGIFGDDQWNSATSDNNDAVWADPGGNNSADNQDKFESFAQTFNNGHLKSAIETITSMQGQVGTALERINNATDYLDGLEEVNIETRDTIKNADMAKEMTAYVRENVLAQASQAMLSQANSGLASVLNLLS